MSLIKCWSIVALAAIASCSACTFQNYSARQGARDAPCVFVPVITLCLYLCLSVSLDLNVRVFILFAAVVRYFSLFEWCVGAVRCVVRCLGAVDKSTGVCRREVSVGCVVGWFQLLLMCEGGEGSLGLS